MHPRSRVALVLAAAAIGLTTPAAADDDSGDDDLVVVPDLEELTAIEAVERPLIDGGAAGGLVVRSTSRLGVPLAEAPGIVTVIMADDLRAMGARTLFEALRYAPELDVTRDAFGFYHVAVRGRNLDTEVLVLLDGHRLNDFYDGRVLFEMPIALVERIEILRGPSSSLYGTNAFAGVISVYTRRRTGRQVQAQIATSGGDREAADVNSLWVSAYHGSELGDRFRLYGSLELAREGGAKLLVPEDSLTRNRMDPDTGLSQSRSCDNEPEDTCPDTAFTSLPRTLARGSAVLESRRRVFTDGDSLTAGAHALFVDRGPFIGEYDTLTPDTRLRRARMLANVNYELPLRRDRSMTLSTGTYLDLVATDREIQVAPDGFKELVEGMSELFPDGQLKAVDYTEVVVRQDLRYKWTKARENSLVVGTEVEHTRMPHFGFAANYDDAGRHYDELGNYFDFPLEQDGKSRTVLSVYAEDLYSAPHGVRLVAGGRFDWYSDFGSAISPRAGAVWRLGDLSLKLFYGWAFRAPTFQELYDQTGRIDLGQFVGNDALDASRVETVEGAVLYQLSLDDLLLEVTLTGAHSSISDSIDRAPLSGLNNTFLNTSDIDSDAASAEVRMELWRRRLSLFVNTSWQSATGHYQYTDPGGAFDIDTTTRLRNVPRYRLNAGVRGQITPRYAAGAFAEVGGSRRNNERTPLEGQHFFDYSPYAILQVYGQAQSLYQGLYLRLGARNVTNSLVADEPFRANRMPLGIPRDRFRIDATLGVDF